MIDSFSGKYEFLSNFFPCSVLFDEVVYPSVEHAFQAAKSLDLIERDRIRHVPTPGQAKRFGRNVHLRPDWERVKVRVMLDLLRSKFSDPTLADLLQKTGDEELVEGNDWGDTFWGMYRGEGRNMLGCLLMQVRGRLSEGMRP